MSDLVEELLVGKDGGILLHDLRKRAATALEAKDKELEALRAAYSCARELLKEAEARAEAAERRVAELEGELFRETERAEVVFETRCEQTNRADEAIAALKPFATYAESEAFKFVHENAPDNLYVMRNSSCANITTITVGDFRRAARAVIEKDNTNG